MGIWTRLFGGEDRSTLSAHPRDPVLATWFGEGSSTTAGANVTATSAMRVTAMFRGVCVISETLAAMPLHLYRRTARGKERATDHPLYDVLHTAPNPWQSSFEWRQMCSAHTVLRGNSYSRVVSTNAGVITGLVPLHPDRVLAFLAPNGRVAFRYQPVSGPAETLLDHEVLHLPDMMLDGPVGVSRVSYHRETIGLSMATKEYLSRFFSNGSATKFGLKIPGQITDDAARALRESWERRHQGVENAHRLAIFDSGMEPVTLGMSNEDAQYIEIQQFNVSDIGRILGVPPHKLGDLSKATFSNIEHQAIEFVTDTILPWVVRTEQRYNRTLLTIEERKKYFIGFDLKGLLRGDSKARAEFYQKLFLMASMSSNDIRRSEDMDEIEGGDVYYVPSNIAPANQLMDVLMRKSTAPNQDVIQPNDNETLDA